MRRRSVARNEWAPRLRYILSENQHICLSVLAVVLALANPSIARNVDPSTLCDAAAEQAAMSADVPPEVMLAITRVETGRNQAGRLAPWPWAVNRTGEGFWFETEAAAIAFGEAELAAGVQNFDVGCFQINLRWHSKGFSSLQDMFDPYRNADYAARLLADLYRSEGGWPKAVAAYHSRSPEHAAPYLRKVETVLAGLSTPEYAAAGQAALPTEPHSRVNRFPLLQPGSQGGFGSLVPFFAAGQPLVGVSP